MSNPKNLIFSKCKLRFTNTLQSIKETKRCSDFKLSKSCFKKFEKQDRGGQKLFSFEGTPPFTCAAVDACWSLDSVRRPRRRNRRCRWTPSRRSDAPPSSDRFQRVTYSKFSTITNQPNTSYCTISIFQLQARKDHSDLIQKPTHFRSNSRVKKWLKEERLNASCAFEYKKLGSMPHVHLFPFRPKN